MRELVLIFLVVCVAAEVSEKFRGKSYWKDLDVEMCRDKELRTPLHQNRTLTCEMYWMDFSPVKVEIVSRDPFLFVYRDFYSQNQIAWFNHMIEQWGQLEATRVIMGHKTVVQDSRVADGIRVQHHENTVIDHLWHHARLNMPAVEFHAAETWQVLNYHKDGHYAPHFDFIPAEHKRSDPYIDIMGNRYITFLFVAKTAKEGGGTVFPRLGTVVDPSAGDVILWQNMEADNTQHDASFHGACPIDDGEKLAATMWVRNSWQRMQCSLEGGILLQPLIRPCGKRFCTRDFHYEFLGWPHVEFEEPFDWEPYWNALEFVCDCLFLLTCAYLLRGVYRKVRGYFKKEEEKEEKSVEQEQQEQQDIEETQTEEKEVIDKSEVRHRKARIG